MIERCAPALALALALALSTPAVAEEAARVVRIAYVEHPSAWAHAARRGYAGLGSRQPASAFPGAELAIRDSRASAEARGLRLELVRRSLGEDGHVSDETKSFLRDAGAVAAILDLAARDLERAAVDMKGAAIALFNIRQRETALRVATCATPLYHAIPSQAMLADALAQYLYFKNWRRVLVLEGGLPDDIAISSAFQRAAKKFGLRIVAVKQFVLGNDPRQRDQTNVALMTAESGHDVVFVADAGGEFARYVPYRTTHPRPVVGSDGLIAAAWHPLWERHGAPQLTRRFERAAGRAMNEEDWAAWVAVRAVVDAALDRSAPPGTSLQAALERADLTLEIYKGAPGSFRAWDRQLRQPILLHTQNAVVDRAPLEGFLHERNTLDTLGLDEPEFRCG